MRLLILLLTLLVVPSLKAAPIRIAALVYNPPFEVEADKKGHFFGFEVDIMMEVCKRIQGDCHFQALTFDQIFKELLTENIDLALGAIITTREREGIFLFSLPYLASSGHFITRANSPIKNIEDIRQKKVGVVRGTLFKDIVLEKYQGVVQVLEYRTLSEAFIALSNNTLDAVITDEEAAKYWATTNSTLFKLVGKSIPIGMGYGMMANKKSTPLINKINKALLDMEADGTYLKIYNRYFSQLSFNRQAIEFANEA